MKKLVSLLLAAVMLIAPCAFAGMPGVMAADPVGADLSAVNAPLLTAGGVPSTTDFFTIEDIASHELTIINVWSDGCGPCVSEMPVFERAYHELAERGVLVVGCCSTWLGGTYAAEWNILSSNGYTYPNYIQDSVLYGLYSGNGVLPQTFIVNSDGFVLEYIDGTISYSRLTQKVDYWFGVMADVHYDVDFVDGVTGEVFETQTVAIGGRPVYPEPPVHEGYTFISWFPAEPPVILGPTTVTANYIVRNWTVKFYDSLTGQKIASQFVPHGSAAQAPEPPVHEGYVFAGWDADFSCVTSNLTVNALYGPAGVSPALPGDVDGDGSVSSVDALTVLRHALGIITLGQDGLAAADLNGDGAVDSSDALLILRAALGI